ncbi:DUF475 domain-containing protein [Pelagimonas varians]|uniref:Integral membrane protein TerC family protein n=1 Tax=Pelagimonas varians TaxID=696760 RepID=A0A238L173_9RHOB|nr:DUF475 domain-containing protein [Pelagimonas varians]PYG26825.1 hypothetical protein C8N36_11916 [Pelagimonas varians]SMX48835.1 Integral membrane protein TerC family protein [Pelagimonas varians]
MKQTLAYFRWPFVFTALGLVLAYWLGYHTTGTISGAMSFFLIGCILAVLEISLSFDNAIVNANILKTMDPKWQHRFLTWGILIAVFGMRIVFPLAIVVLAAKIGPISAIVLAATEPLEYGRIMDDAHIGISAFGGTFLMMVSLTYFIDQSKEVDWIKSVECRLRSLASIRGLEIAVVLFAALMLASALPLGKSATFLFAAVCGLVTFLAVELVAHFLDSEKEVKSAAAKGGFGAFLYLEVLDASFSFDGVIGAFALTQNLFLIAIGLGIGAFYVRSMTIMLVERNTLSEFRYLEHGAFYSVLALSIIMYAQSLLHIPELFTGLIGAALISLSLYSSIRHNNAEQNT